MDTRAYISTGILESYVLSEVTDQERKEVECLSHIYPEIKQELELVQFNLEALSFQGSITPPSSVKLDILNAIKNLPQEEAEDTSRGTDKIENKDSEKKESKVIPLNADTAEKKAPVVWKMLVAASVIGLIFSVGLSYLSLQKVNKSSGLAADIKQDRDAIYTSYQNVLNREKQLVSSIDATEAQLNFVGNSKTKKIVLAGTDAHKESESIVYWNEESKKGYIQLTSLPSPAIDKDYQLWAIVGGKPVDLGVVDLNNNELVLHEFPDVSEAQAFAITLEEKGGKPTPNLEQLFVIGNT